MGKKIYIWEKKRGNGIKKDTVEKKTSKPLKKQKFWKPATHAKGFIRDCQRQVEKKKTKNPDHENTCKIYGKKGNSLDNLQKRFDQRP